jgi:hypothetical protein
MRIKLKFWFFEHYWWLLIVVAIVLLVGISFSKEQLSTSVGVVGAILSLIYFLQKQKFEELKLFRELFKEFNERYDGLNERLAKVAESDLSEVSPEERELLVDYFNLCGEEYFYYQKGYIDPAVWVAWHNGMKALVSVPRIHAIWKVERRTDSYYRLEIL